MEIARHLPASRKRTEADMEITNSGGTVRERALRKTDRILDAFRTLGKEDSAIEGLFQEIRFLYDGFDGREKEAFFGALLESIEVPKEDLEDLIHALMECGKDDPLRHGLLAELRRRVYSPRLKLFRKISHCPGGLKFLLDFRGDLLSVRRSSNIDLAPLDEDIVFLLEMHFQEGFLYLEEITLNSSFNQIALIKNRDMVHPMASIEEMGQRLGKDRRCFALYHRLLPLEPVIFIEVALTEGLVRKMSEIVAPTHEEERNDRVDTAIFYSINNTQNGLAGLGLGKILIGKVVHYLRKEDERIKNFATLSPMPGFWRRYLRLILEGKDESFSLRQSEVVSFFQKKSIEKVLAHGPGGKWDRNAFHDLLLGVLSTGEWVKDEELREEFRGPLVKIAYHYLVNEKNPQGKPLDPVTNFHLGLGATVSARNVNFLANPSEKGLRESCGMMVNYVYSSNWLSQIRRSLRWFDRLEVKGLFSRE
jgi:malonyl-CoA decarboxylase